MRMFSLRRQGFNPKAEVQITRPGHSRIRHMNTSISVALVTFDRDWLRVEEVPTYDVWVDLVPRWHDRGARRPIPAGGGVHQVDR